MKKRGFILVLFVLILIILSMGVVGDTYVCKTALTKAVSEGDYSTCIDDSITYETVKKEDCSAIDTTKPSVSMGGDCGYKIICLDDKVSGLVWTIDGCWDESTYDWYDCDIQNCIQPTPCEFQINKGAGDYCLCSGYVYKNIDGGFCCNSFSEESPDENCIAAGDEDCDGLIDCRDDDCDKKTCAGENQCVANACVDTSIPEFSLPTLLITLTSCLLIIGFFFRKR